MPALITDALAACRPDRGSRPPLRLVRVEPGYHARFADGRHLDVYADRDAMAAEVQRFAGTEEARRYLRSAALARLTCSTPSTTGSWTSNFDSPLDLVTSGPARRDLARWSASAASAAWADAWRHFLSDPDLARVFTFQALYAGLAPADALGVYGAIAHMDTSLGVYFPVGGMRAIARSMADALQAAGGIVETQHRRRPHRVRGAARDPRVRTADGRRFDCDALVLTADLGESA